MSEVELLHLQRWRESAMACEASVDREAAERFRAQRSEAEVSLAELAATSEREASNMQVEMAAPGARAGGAA